MRIVFFFHWTFDQLLINLFLETTFSGESTHAQTPEKFLSGGRLNQRERWKSILGIRRIQRDFKNSSIIHKPIDLSNGR